MSHQASGARKTPAGESPQPKPAAKTPELDLRKASASQLIVEVMHLEELILAAGLHEPTIVDLIGREQCIREELRCRKSLLMQGLRWDTLAALVSGSPSRPAGHPRTTDGKAGNRGGPAGPGRWDD
jgi:hypothetical protein